MMDLTSASCCCCGGGWCVLRKFARARERRETRTQRSDTSFCARRQSSESQVLMSSTCSDGEAIRIYCKQNPNRTIPRIEQQDAISVCHNTMATRASPSPTSPKLAPKKPQRRASKLLTSNRKSLLFHLSLAIIFLSGLLTCGAQSQSQDGGQPAATSQFVTHTIDSEALDGVAPSLAASSATPVTAAASSSSSSSSSSQAAGCFGGLQTFEKISMSSFENPSGLGSNGASGGSNSGAGNFGSGILIQQDDQALTSECINLCRSQSNCLSFVIDYNKFECKSYATTQQELQQEFYAKFQSARATSQNESDSLSGGGGGGYQQQASASSVNNLVQQLLPSASSNYFEKICLDGVAQRQQFNDVCGANRLWTIERVVDSYLDGFVEKEVTNVNGKDECSKLCLFETQFVCRSADYDQHSRLCRLSKEDRRTQPQAMRHVPNSLRQYLENQCATPGPSSCVYEQRKNVGIISMDALKFSQTAQDCQMKCNQETTFNCRSYSFHQQRCFLSGDDSVSLNSNLIKLPTKQGWTFGEKKCLVELCSKGIFSYEKITGFTLRSALSTSIDLMMPGGSSAQYFTASNPHHDALLQQESGQIRTRHIAAEQQQNSHSSSRAANLVSAMMNMMMSGEALDPMQESSSSSSRQVRAAAASNLAITEHCRHSCDLGYLNCPAFTIDYRNNRCQRLDRNSQGRHHELVAREAFAYYEKICLRVPEIMSMCQDKYWIFERVIGYELAPRLYDKTLKFVQSRRDCQEYCLEEKQFQCRSALYNDETSDCKLSAYDRRMALAEGGYYRNFNARISYLENNCIRDQDAQRRQCSYEQTRDEPAYPTFTERIETLPASANPNPNPNANNNNTNSNLLTASYSNLPVSSSSSQYDIQQPGANRQSANYQQQQHLTGSAHCEQLCNDNAKFECHSFGYYASTAQCFLSGDDSVSAGEMAATPSTGFSYFERKCRPIDNSGNAGNQTNQQQDPTRSQMPGSLPLTTPSSATTAPSINPYLPQPAQATTSMPGLASSSSSRPAGSSFGTNPNASASEADVHKCGMGHTFVYQRIAGFEPIGGYLTLLLRNNEQPGIVAECADLCRRAFECRAFVVDYSSNQCYAMLENSSVGLLSLRQTLGKDYFEGFCLANHLLHSSSPVGGVSSPTTAVSTNCGQKSWLIDKIVDQAVVGVQYQKVLADSSRSECRQACLEERLFWCKSAMFESATSECKLYSIERESTPQMRLLFTKGVDFFENQCQISSQQCAYDAIERDQTHITVTKSVQARSTFDCELACNLELGFNCRSYTYLDQYPSLPNLCLLSSDSRSTSQRGSIHEMSKALYAERNCFYRRPRIPGLANPGGGSHMVYNNDLLPHTGTGSGSSSSGTRAPTDPYAITMMSHNQQQQHHQHSTEHEEANHHQQADGGLSSPPQTPNGLDLEAPPGLALGQAQCEPHQFTFERTFGYDFKLAPKERAPIAPTIGIAIGCQQECLKRAGRCQAFVIDYALPYQSCFLLESQAGANKRQLVRAPNTAYFEKICLPRNGLQTPSSSETASESLSHHSPMLMMTTNSMLHNDQTQDVVPHSSAPMLDITPSYSHEPWTPQLAPNQLPYYLQQQHLAHSYPSRSCPKLWAFERFVNHNFTAPVDRSIADSLTRTQCETACINEASFACRSATYDYSLKLCRLFRNTRRTILSQFVDLSAPAPSEQQSSSNSAPKEDTQTGSANSLEHNHPNHPHHPGTAQVLAGNEQSQNNESIQISASSSTLIATSPQATGRQPQFAKQLHTAEPLSSGKNIDYLENTCTPEPSSCQYRQIYDQFSPYIDKVLHASSLTDCQRQCDQERLFSCKSLNYDPHSRNCMLVNEDLLSLQSSRGTAASSSSSSISNARQAAVLLPKKGTIYSEKGNCEMISVQCTSQEMLVMLNFDAPFRGRIMAKGNPEQCYLLGDGQTSLQFPIVFGPKCNSRQEGHNTFVNEVIIQQHPVIMTDNDKTVRIMCAFEAPDQTITLKGASNAASGNSNGSSGGGGAGAGGGGGSSSSQTVHGIDVAGTPESSRTRHDKQHFSSVVSSKASPPAVVLRILEAQNGRDASNINLGDDLQLRIQMQLDAQPQQSALGIFARNLAARSSNGESLLLIDQNGCPVDPQVFPALEIDPRDGRSLQSQFKAFRFPSSGLVNFEVQIRFCPEKCQPVECHKSQPRTRSFGRRRRRKRDLVVASESGHVPILQSGIDQESFVDRHQLPMQLESLSTVMKPGKAFEYVRKLLQVEPSSSSSPAEAESNNNGPPTNEAPSMVGDEDQKSHQELSPTTSSSVEEFDTNPPASVQQTFSPRESATTGETFSPIPGPPEPSNHEQQSFGSETQSSTETSQQVASSMSSTNEPQREPTSSLQSSVDEFDSLTRTGHQDQQQQQQQQGTLPTVSSQSAPYDGRFPLVEPSDMMLEHLGHVASHQRDGPQSAANEQNISHNNNNKDMPLRFSILVGETNPTNNISNNHQTTNPQVTVVSSAAPSTDSDHIVTPGRGQQQVLDIEVLNNKPIVGNHLDQHQRRAIAAEKTMTLSHNAMESSATNPMQINPFDTVVQSSSSSISSEVNISPAPANAGELGTAASQQQQQQLAESAATNCQLEQAARAKLRTIIWAGGLVIALNVCLVVVSLFLYFKRVHLRHFDTHTFHSTAGSTVATSSELNGSYSTSSLAPRQNLNDAPRSSYRNYWPSLLVLSSRKNRRMANLGGERTLAGPTSLSAHEHFFCKLNSGRSTSSANKHHDNTSEHFDWPPNLSSSSNHSTISSLASPMPPLPQQALSTLSSSTLNTNQGTPQRGQLRRPSLSSMQIGNFNAFAEDEQRPMHLNGVHRTILDIGHHQSGRPTVADKYNARYTNNIDRDQYSPDH